MKIIKIKELKNGESNVTFEFTQKEQDELIKYAIKNILKESLSNTLIDLTLFYIGLTLDEIEKYIKKERIKLPKKLKKKK